MRRSPSDRHVVLLVEDSPGDVRLVREALEETADVDLRVVGDGAEALEYLHGDDRVEHEPRPSVILLDLNLPRLDGRELLRIVKADPDLVRIPVIILTTSVSDAEVALAYDLGANCYVSKPLDFDAFVAMIASITRFWLRLVRLPTAV